MAAPGILKTITPWGRGEGHFLLHSIDVQRANIGIVLAASLGDLPAGTALARLQAATSAVKASGANTGNATVSAVTTLAGAKPGIYTVRFTAATTFNVEDPNGDPIGSGTTGVAFADDLGFTITAGGTPMVAGDGFDITVAANGNWKVWDPTATDGTENWQGFLWGDRSNLATTQKAVATVREVTINANALPGWAALSTPNKAALVSAAEAQRIIIQA
jgi:hypothetical protein